MHASPPADACAWTGTTVPVQDSGDADRKRQLARERKRRQRDREQDGGRFYRVYVRPSGIRAVTYRNVDSGLMTVAEAERAALSSKKVAVDLAEVIEQWAARYLAKRDRA